MVSNTRRRIWGGILKRSIKMIGEVLKEGLPSRQLRPNRLRSSLHQHQRADPDDSPVDLFLESANVRDQGLDFIIRKTLDWFHQCFPFAVFQTFFESLEG